MTELLAYILSLFQKMITTSARDTSYMPSVVQPLQNLLKVIRDTHTSDAIFGKMYWNNSFLAITMERTAVAIPEGTYPGRKRDSSHFGMRVIGIDAPNRSDIECHPANYPCELKGCIAVGESKDGDALDNSRAAFDRMMLALPDEFTVEVSSNN